MGILNTVPESYDGAILFDGFEDALIGFGTQFNRPVAIYSWLKMVGQLAQENGAMCEDREACQADHWSEAEEYIEFNTAGGWFGENTPIILREHWPIKDEDEEPQGCKHCGNVSGGCTC